MNVIVSSQGAVSELMEMKSFNCSAGLQLEGSLVLLPSSGELEH